MAYRHVVRNPRLQSRVFLPNWFLKVVRPGKEQPDNVVQFHVPMDMSKLDVKNYLQCIYKVNVANVNTRIQYGKTKQVAKGGRLSNLKLPDYKVAYVTLAEGNFRFPDLFPKEAAEHELDSPASSVAESEKTKEETTAGAAEWFDS